MYTVNPQGKQLILQFENIKLQAYLDSAGIPTIGVGNTYYEDGTPVKMGDLITYDRAVSLFDIILKPFVHNISNVVKSNINQNQGNALLSLSYNIGINGFNNSTVLRLVNANPNDLAIIEAFKLWDKADGIFSEGLLNRRIKEAQIYFN